MDSRLTFIRMVDTPPKTPKKALYQCTCGNAKIINCYDVRVKSTLSCGCLKFTSKRTHGFARTRLYGIWMNMKDRCYNPKHERYKDWGGRGISICDEWLNNPSEFFKWSISNGYEKSLQIDRERVDGNYEPSNCRWVTGQVNANNRRNNVYIEFNGVNKTIADWARELGIKKVTLVGRIRNYKWPIERALTEKVNR